MYQIQSSLQETLCGPELCFKFGSLQLSLQEKRNPLFHSASRTVLTAFESLETKIATGIITVVTVSLHGRCCIHRLLPLHPGWLVLQPCLQKNGVALFCRHHSCQQTCTNKPAAFTNICTRYTGPDLILQKNSWNILFHLVYLIKGLAV